MNLIKYSNNIEGLSNDKQIEEIYLQFINLIL